MPNYLKLFLDVWIVIVVLVLFLINVREFFEGP